MKIAETVGERMYLAAGMSPAAPHSRGAVEVIARVFGPRAIELLDGIIGGANYHLDTVDGERRIVLPATEPPRRLHFLAACGAAQAWLETHPCEVATQHEQRLLYRAIAAYLVAPTPAFLAAVEAMGPDVHMLADVFKTGTTAIALRLHETMGRSTIVVAPDHMHRRGDLLPNTSDEQVREMIDRREVIGLRRVRLRDEPDRVALFSAA